MNKVYILLGAAWIFLIVGFIIAKIGSNKSKMGVTVLGLLLMVAGCISGFFCYETYNMAPVTYTVSNYREVDNGYQLTLGSDVKGLTGGAINISNGEALSLGLVELDENGKEKWLGGEITQSRQWIKYHRD